MFEDVMNIHHYYNTLKYLKLKQMLYRLYYRFMPGRIVPAQGVKLKKPAEPWITPINKPQCFKTPANFTFLNETHAIESAQDWNNSAWEKLWLYHLHYFDEVVPEMLIRWARENPLGKGNGWEPYPISLRLVNVFKYFLAGNTLPQEFMATLYQQIDYLSHRIEWHLMGNHVLANAKALIFAGCCVDHPQSNQWLNQGLNIFSEQLKEQVTESGAHFELSPMYHAIILEDIFDVVNVLQAYSDERLAQFTQRTSLMFSWLAKMTHPDGQLSFFNDACLHQAPTFGELKAYAERMDGELTIVYQNDEYVRLERGKFTLIADVANVLASYIPGHTHADTLSFELSYGAQRVFVNSGISTYEKNALRQWQRSTAAHNCLVIDGQNSSEVWGGFRLARRAQVNRSQSTEARATSECAEGRCVIPAKSGLCYQRIWQLTESSLTIEDHVTGDGQHTIEIYFYFHPEVQVTQLSANIFQLIFKGERLQFIAPESTQNSLEDAEYYPAFGVTQRNQRIRCFQKSVILPRIWLSRLGNQRVC